MAGLSLPIRVYLEDTDAQGLVYNASYFRFMERARTEWLRAQGVDHDELRERHGILLVLTRVEAKFMTPARLSDLLYVEARVADVRGVRIVFEHGIRRNVRSAVEGAGSAGELVCRGIAEVACIDAESGKPRRIPKTLLSELSQ